MAILTREEVTALVTNLIDDEGFLHIVKEVHYGVFKRQQLRQGAIRIGTVLVNDYIETLDRARSISKR